MKILTITFAPGLPLDQVFDSSSTRPFTVCDEGEPITTRESKVPAARLEIATL